MLQFWKGFRYTILILGTMTSPKAGRTLRNSLRRWTRSKHIRRLKTILCFCLILPRIILRLDTIDSESMVSFLLLFYLPIGTNKLAVTFPDCLKTWQSGISPLIEDKYSSVLIWWIKYGMLYIRVVLCYWWYYTAVLFSYCTLFISLVKCSVSLLILNPIIAK